MRKKRCDKVIKTEDSRLPRAGQESFCTASIQDKQIKNHRGIMSFREEAAQPHTSRSLSP